MRTLFVEPYLTCLHTKFYLSMQAVLPLAKKGCKTINKIL